MNKLKSVYVYKWDSMSFHRNRIDNEAHILIDFKTILLIKKQVVHILIDPRTIVLSYRANYRVMYTLGYYLCKML